MALETKKSDSAAEEVFNFTPEDFEPASREQRDNFIADRKSTTYWRDAMRRLAQNAVSMVALGVIIFLVLFAFLGPVIVPYGYDQFNAGAENLYPWHYSLSDQRLIDESAGDPETRLARAFAEAEEEKGEPLNSREKAIIRATVNSTSVDIEQFIEDNGIKQKPFGYSRAELLRLEDGESVFPHVFGTDKYGRDIMVRTMMGTRVSMLVGLFAAFLVLLVGAVGGSVSGYFGGVVDTILMRIVELIDSIPEMLVVIMLSTTLSVPLSEYINSGAPPELRSFLNVLGANIIAMFFAFAMLYWGTMARIIRGQILQLKEQEYVTAAIALGAKPGRVILRHLLPNCVGQIVVTTCLQIPAAIFLESFLSFVGIGVSAPLTSLGSMASDALAGVQTYPYRLIIPALILSILILAFNLFGDGLRDALDPKLKK